MEKTREILQRGTSADRQLARFDDGDEDTLLGVVKMLAEETRG